ncbi:MAG: ABC transporter ATP-binding protein [Armatimonadota bacterium]
MEIVVEACGLEKRFGAFSAVDRLDLVVERGDVFGFLGPNGAGKSTTIRMMLGLIKPSNGSVRVLGNDTWRNRTRALLKVGALVESPGLYKNLTARQNIRVLSEMTGGINRQEIDKALEQTGLLDRSDDRVRSFSHGMKQRLGIAQAIVGSPELVILDEPTNGLDPQGMKEVRELIKKLSKDYGMTIFLSSHLLHEVEQVCTKVAVIHKGKKVASGSVPELLSGKGRLRITVNKPSEAAAVVDGSGFAKVDEVGPGWIVVGVQDGCASEINRRLVTAGFDVSAVIPVSTSLEEFYFSLMGACDVEADQA